jgi:DNA-binding response OmpR family regulator
MKILVVDDDRELADLLRYTFQRAGYRVMTAFDGESALKICQLEMPDVVVLDLMMPKSNGINFLEEIRRTSSVPVIVLTALGDEEHVVQALHLGADDYLVKPFRPRELKARVRALLRRSQAQTRTEAKNSQPLSVGGIILDPRSREVTVAGQPVQLTRTEFALLHFLMLNRNALIQASDILANIWGYDSDQSIDVVRVNISRLRRKLESQPSNPRIIVTGSGGGYKLQSNE